LAWLKKVKQETGLLTAVEIGQADHLRACLEQEVDIIWIGARTVVNPFSMQEIADVLASTDIPVFVKNPVNPDLNLWIGAIERINRAGITRLAAIHRGFYSLRPGTHRNNPMWEIPIELKRLHPELPLICDPSHISGHRHLVEKIAQYALDLDMDGLMIEAHISPDQAKTDSEQQITPQQLGKLLETFRYHTDQVKGKSTDMELMALRNSIDQLDANLLDTLAKRMEIVKQIGRLKKMHGITAFQVQRWNEIKERFIETGTLEGLDRKFLEDLLETVHNESLRLQSRLFTGEDDQ
jgi:chorismate mutase